jgi:hypothetical protein
MWRWRLLRLLSTAESHAYTLSKTGATCETMIFYILILTVDCLFTKVLIKISLYAAGLLWQRSSKTNKNLEGAEASWTQVEPMRAKLGGVLLLDFLPSEQKPGIEEHVLLQFLVLDPAMSRACLAPYQKSTLSQNQA